MDHLPIPCRGISSAIAELHWPRVVELVESNSLYNAHAVSRCDRCVESFLDVMTDAPLEVQRLVAERLCGREIGGSATTARRTATNHLFDTMLELVEHRLRGENFGEAATALVRASVMRAFEPSADRAIFESFKAICRHEAISEACGLAETYRALDRDISLPGPSWRDVARIHGLRYSECRLLPGRIIADVGAKRSPTLAAQMLAWACTHCRWHVLRSIPQHVSPRSDVTSIAMKTLAKNARPSGRAYLECIHAGVRFVEEPSAFSIDDDVEF